MSTVRPCWWMGMGVHSHSGGRGTGWDGVHGAEDRSHKCGVVYSSAAWVDGRGGGEEGIQSMVYTFV